jgi:hypothetical protein
MSISRSGRLRAAIVGGTLVGALALPAAVSADTTGAPPILPPASNGATVTVASVTTIGKVVATVNLTVVCHPFEELDWDTGQTYLSTQGSIEDGEVTILQAQGRTLDSGSNSVFGPLAVCDGSTANHLSIPVTPSVSPWKKGAAVVGAFVRIADVISFQASDFASTGPVSERLG